MLPIHDFPLFILAGILLNMTPGPDTAFVVGRSAVGGARAGVAAALGIGAGSLFHTALAAVGLSALLVASEAAFSAVKWAGAAYLAYLGIRMMLAQAVPAAVAEGGETRVAAIFWQGCLTNVLNPKVALFFLAFMPQFIDASGDRQGLAFVALGLTFTATGTLWNSGMAWFAGRVSGSMMGQRARLWLERGLGAAFLGFGIRLALAER